MGSSSSTRKITVVNDDSSGVIKISDSVVNRLRGELENQSSKNRKAESDVKPPVQQSEHRPIPPAKPPILPSKPPVEKTEPKIRMTKEDMKQAESYWRDRFYESEAKSAELHNQTVVEFNKSLEEVEALFHHPTNACYLACEDLEAKVVKCYQENAGKTLNCAPQVKDFVNCVESMRARAFVAKG